LSCKRQEEQKLLTICRENLPKKVLHGAFVLTYDKMRRYEGVWHLERKLLFPECIFLESGQEEALLKELMQGAYFGNIIEGKSRLLQVGQNEENLLRRLCGKQCHLEMSKGIICKGVTRITEGPLKGMENRILRIDRHKRLARVEITGKPNESFYYEQKMESGMKMKPEYRYIPAGLEITEKVV
jgi:transcriptional antiterminator NusG